LIDEGETIMLDDRSIELDEDLRFQRVEWIVQRVSWVLWAGIIVAALAGLVGPGPLSNTEASASDGLITVAYERFVHYHHPTTIDIMLGPSAEVGNPARVKLSQTLLDRLEVLRIEPEPESREVTSDGIVYSFPMRLKRKPERCGFTSSLKRPVPPAVRLN
jgi:hypothetical protein